MLQLLVLVFLCMSVLKSSRIKQLEQWLIHRARTTLGKDAMKADGTINQRHSPPSSTPRTWNALEQALRLKDEHPAPPLPS